MSLVHEAIGIEGVMLKHMVNHADIFWCPACGGNLGINTDTIHCLSCLRHYKIENGIPLLFLPSEGDNTRKNVENAVKLFYDETPFPNYEESENISDLIQKAQKNLFARLLNEQIPFNIKVLEVGCGTGQLSNLLGVSQRIVFGTDMSIPSLKLAQEFKQNNKLERVGFYQMNLFRPIFKEESFSLVICNGVLHHTSDPSLGFQIISRLVKKGGYIIIGLYNKFGRLATNVRRSIFKVFNFRLKFLDPLLVGNNKSDIRKKIWFIDQYRNPYESEHTVGEVLNWFEQAGFDFVNSIPKLRAFDGISDKEKLFQGTPKGTMLDHFIVQACFMFSGSREGGLFIMIGRRRP